MRLEWPDHPLSQAVIPCVLVLGFTQHAFAQAPFSADFRLGAARVTNDARGLAVDPGYGFQVTARYNIISDFGVYASWSRYHFDAESVGDFIQSLEIEDTGYAIGMTFEPSLVGPLALHLSAGGMYHNVGTHFSRRSYSAGYDIGWESAAALPVQVTDWLTLSPGVRYVSQRPDKYGDFPTPWNLRYLVTEAGVRMHF